MSLDAKRLIDVDDGSQFYLNPEHEVAWSEGLVVVKADNKLRIVYLDQARTVTAEDANRLSLGGLGRPAGSRLFDNPELCRQIFMRRSGNELELILASAAGSRRAIEFGTRAGHLLLPLRAAGLAIDGLDSSERCVTWLTGELARIGSSGVSIFLGDLASIAFPHAYDFALAGPSTLRHLPNLARLRRHFHLAALSVAPGGRYLFSVTSHGDLADEPQPGLMSREQIRNDSGQLLEIEWSLIRRDHVSSLNLERIRISIDGRAAHDEHQLQLNLSLAQWRAAAERDSEWSFEQITDDSGVPLSPEVFETGRAATYWISARRT